MNALSARILTEKARSHLSACYFEIEEAAKAGHDDLLLNASEDYVDALMSTLVMDGYAVEKLKSGFVRVGW